MLNNRNCVAAKLLQPNFDGLVQDCNISIANALGILQSCTNPSTEQFALKHLMAVECENSVAFLSSKSHY